MFKASIVFCVNAVCLNKDNINTQSKSFLDMSTRNLLPQFFSLFSPYLCRSSNAFYSIPFFRPQEPVQNCFFVIFFSQILDHYCLKNFIFFKYNAEWFYILKILLNAKKYNIIQIFLSDQRKFYVTQWSHSKNLLVRPLHTVLYNRSEIILVGTYEYIQNADCPRDCNEILMWGLYWPHNGILYHSLSSYRPLKGKYIKRCI